MMTSLAFLFCTNQAQSNTSPLLCVVMDQTADVLLLQGPSGAGSQRQTATDDDDDDWDAPDPDPSPIPQTQQLISPFQMVPQNKKR